MFSGPGGVGVANASEVGSQRGLDGLAWSWVHLGWDTQSRNHASHGDPTTLHNSAWQGLKGTHSGKPAGYLVLEAGI